MHFYHVPAHYACISFFCVRIPTVFRHCVRAFLLQSGTFLCVHFFIDGLDCWTGLYVQHFFMCCNCNFSTVVCSALLYVQHCYMFSTVISVVCSALLYCNLFGRRPPRSCISRAGGETREPDFLMYVCMYVCMYICIYIYIYIYVYACMHLCMHVCVYVYR